MRDRVRYGGFEERDPALRGRSLLLFSRLVGMASGLALLASCAPVGGGESGRSGPSPVDEGSVAARTLDDAVDLARDGQADSARVIVRDVLRRARSSADSATAFTALSRVELEAARFSDAADAADLAIALADSERGEGEARLLSATGHLRLGDLDAALDRLVGLPDDSDRISDAVSLLSDGRFAPSPEAFIGAADRVGADHPVIGNTLVEFARDENASGSRARAATLADAALRRGATGSARRDAEALLEAVGGRVVLGVMVSQQASPALQNFSALIREGVDVAVDEFTRGSAFEVEVSVVDDRGLPRIAAQRIAALEDAGVVGVVGPLQGTNVEAAAGGRAFPVAIVSPTARGVGDGSSDGVYSLQGLDPGSAERLAQHLVEEGAQRIVVMHPNTHASRFETQVLRNALQERGSGLLAEIPYDSSLTFFREPVDQMIGLDPDAVVFPMEASDLGVLAPQLSFFGVDTLEVQRYGTAAWASSAVLQSVDPRHTTGVIVAAAPEVAGGSLGSRAFIRLYEDFHQRSLRSDVPALGYDAARLVLAGVAGGGRTPQGVRDWLDADSDGVDGATGRIFLRDGRIVREHDIVVMYEGSRLTLDEGRAIEELFLGPGRPGLAAWLEERRGGGG